MKTIGTVVVYKHCKYNKLSMTDFWVDPFDLLIPKLCHTWIVYWNTVVGFLWLVHYTGHNVNLCEPAIEPYKKLPFTRKKIDTDSHGRFSLNF